MKRTAIVADPVFREHDTGPGHPETSERLSAIYSLLEKRGLLAKAIEVPLQEVTDEDLLRVHTKEHLRRIASTASRERAYLDGDTPTSSKSYSTARLAAGSLIEALETVLAARADNAFALIRPPGHHAEADRAMGFCLFNNIAVAAAHALEKHGLKKILIVDWDVHHGNATQHTFYEDPRVLFFSIHHYPFYPGTGGLDEIGAGRGRGYTVNVPIPGGYGDEFYDAAFARILTPVARAFQPELILISAGFDSHYRDPLGGMRVTEEGFMRLAGRLKALAEEFCQGRVVATLEGGYNLQALAQSVAGVIEVLMEISPAPKTPLAPPPNFDEYIKKVRNYLADKWPAIGEG